MLHCMNSQNSYITRALWWPLLLYYSTKYMGPLLKSYVPERIVTRIATAFASMLLSLWLQHSPAQTALFDKKPGLPRQTSVRARRIPLQPHSTERQLLYSLLSKNIIFLDVFGRDFLQTLAASLSSF